MSLQTESSLCTTFSSQTQVSLREIGTKFFKYILYYSHFYISLHMVESLCFEDVFDQGLCMKVYP